MREWPWTPGHPNKTQKTGENLRHQYRRMAVSSNTWKELCLVTTHTKPERSPPSSPSPHLESAQAGGHGCACRGGGRAQAGVPGAP